eukprot:1254848-Prymnesium_polylepis.1
MVPPPPAPPAIDGAPGMGQFKKKEPRRPQTPMRKLHWTKVPDRRVPGTVWESELSDANVTLDGDEVERNFGVATTTVPSAASNEDVAKRATPTPCSPRHSSSRSERRHSPTHSPISA